MKQFLRLSLICITLVLSYCEAKEEDYIVRTDLGFLRGKKETSLNGKEFFSFLSVPYAKPPVRDLRFKDPVAVEPWEGLLDATAEPDYCWQFSFFEMVKADKSNVRPRGSEDCLYLNIYTSQPKKINAKLPVMVFIHGGGFFSGGTHEYGPYALMNKEIVLVFVQYRLNLFGFLSTEDSILPGNMGLKDQQLALKWIQQNIIHFGGDPGKVTIFGESAGGASVHLQMLSPGSKGLFQRVIAQSGTALSPWGRSNIHRKFAKFLGDEVHCSLDDGSKAYLECMQSKDAETLLLLSTKHNEWIIFPTVTVPRVDGTFLPEDPEILLKEGKYNKVDLMLGITRDEGALLSTIFCASPDFNEGLNSNFNKNGPYSLAVESDPESEKLAREIYHYYTRKEIKDINTSDQQVMKLYTDVFFGIDFDTVGTLHSNDDEISTYLYQLDHVGSRSFTHLFPECARDDWISHGDDMCYIFSGGELFQLPLVGEEDEKLREIILSLWTNFARTGNPTSSNLDFVWERATHRDFRHLSLVSPQPKMVNSIRSDIRRYWLAKKVNRYQHMIPDIRSEILTNEDITSNVRSKSEL